MRRADDAPSACAARMGGLAWAVEGAHIEGGESAAYHKEEDASDCMHGHEVAGDQKEREHVVVLAHDELERVHVDGVGCASARAGNAG